MLTSKTTQQIDAFFSKLKGRLFTFLLFIYFLILRGGRRMKTGKVGKKKGRKWYKRVNTNIKSNRNKTREEETVSIASGQDETIKTQRKEKKRAPNASPRCLSFYFNEKVQALETTEWTCLQKTDKISTFCFWFTMWLTISSTPLFHWHHLVAKWKVLVASILLVLKGNEKKQRRS